MALNLEFLNGVRRRTYGPGLFKDFVVKTAIESVVVKPRSLTVYRGADSSTPFLYLEGRLLAALVRNGARRQQNHLRELSDVQRQIHNLLGTDNCDKRTVSDDQCRRYRRILHLLRH